MSTASDTATPHLLRQALVTVRALKARVARLESEQPEPLAVVGMGCRFPAGADDPDSLWTCFAEGVDAVGEVPASRWEQSRFFDSDPQAPGKTYTRWGSFVDRVDEFDPMFFGVSPREAVFLDPQHRILLEGCSRALEDAGLGPAAYRGDRTGLFVGISSDDYYQMTVSPAAAPAIEPYTAAGTSRGMGVGRVAYLMGLTGPALALDTTCSSSLVAVHQAGQSLRAGECDIALAGGVQLMLSPLSSVIRSKLGALSPTGRCRSFDADADGFVTGEGCGVVVLRRLSDALAAGDHIRAVIRGSAVNHNGGGNGPTAPSSRAQEALIRQCLSSCGVEPAAVDYVEAHGTGTVLGDPIEVAALGAVFADRPEGRPLVIGSAKANFGHLEAAAGILSFCKTVLALRHRTIPRQLHFARPNPHIPWDSLPIRIATRPLDWDAGETPRTAGVSSFGMSGTNAFVVVEEAPRSEPSPADDGVPRVLPLSAGSDDALAELATRTSERLAADSGLWLASVARTLATGRAHHSHRMAVVATTTAEAADRLAAAARGRPARGVARGTAGGGGGTPCAFLFSGQGVQHPGMGAALYDTEPAYRRAIDTCDEIVRPLLGRSLTEITAGEDPAALNDTGCLQPALFAVEYALSELWRHRGVRPAAVLGHSLGEYVAACVAGVMGLDDALGLVVERARLMGELPRGGRMAAAFCDEATAEAAVRTRSAEVSIAAVNGLEECVVSGREGAVGEVVAELGAAGIETRPLAVSHAFHSPLMDPVLGAFGELVGGVALQAPQVPLVSNLTGRRVIDEITTPAYWTEHLRRPVRFHAGLRTLVESGITTFLEIGPRPALATLGSRNFPADGLAWVASLQPDAPLEQQAHAVAALHVRGVPVRWESLVGDSAPRAPLPTYPFERHRYWNEATVTTMGSTHTPDELRLQSEVSQPGSFEAVPEGTPQEIVDSVTGILSELMHVDAGRFDSRRSLLELGVDSFILVAAVHEIRERHGVRLSIRQIFESLTTVEAMAGYIAQRAGGNAQPRTPPVPSPAVPQPAVRSPAVQAPATATEAAPSRPAGITGPIAPTGAAQYWEAPVPQVLTSSQRAFVDRFTARYTARTARSKAHRVQAEAHCNNRRSSAGFRLETKELLYPIVAERSSGATLYDIDGNEYVDIAMGFGAHFYGHAPDFLVGELDSQLRRGIHLGPEVEQTEEVARMIRDASGMDRVLFNASGTEAVTTALRIARAATSRPKVAVFANSYHGHFDGTLVVPDGGGIDAAAMSTGTPPGMVADVLVLPYDSERALRAIAAHASELAAVLVEPVQNRRPDLHPGAFLKELRTLTRVHGIALIFDEILVGFRVGLGGAQQWFGVEADLVTYGKVVGAGLPMAVVAGRAEFMDRVDGGSWRYGDDSYPRVETVYTAGTYAKHPLAIAAARAVLTRMTDAKGADHTALNERSTQLAERLDAAFERLGVPLSVARFGSFFRFAVGGNLSFAYQPLELDLFCYGMIDRRVYLWEGRTCFLSAAHTDADLDHIVSAATETVTELKEAGFWPERAAASQRLPAADTGAPAPSTASSAVRADWAPLPVAAPRPAATSALGPRFSLYYFGDYGAEFSEAKYDLLMAGARFADAHDFEAVWVPERHFHSFGGFSPNPSVLAASLAQATTRVDIRGSVVLPLHSPIRVAEEWSVVHNLSGGRAGIAFASGWHTDDFVLAPEVWGRHREALDEGIDTVRSLWRGESVTFPNGAGEPKDVTLFPLPGEPEPRIWLTALGNPETFAKAGRIGAGIVTNLIGQSVEELASKVRIYREARAEAGHDPDGGHVTVLVHTFVGADLEEVRERARAPFMRYLASSMDLLTRLIGQESAPAGMDDLTEEDRDYLLGKAYERYVGERALVGTPESCGEVVRALSDAGADELACFVDFGVDASDVVDGFAFLERLRARTAAGLEPQGTSGSVRSPVRVSGGTRQEGAHSALPVTEDQWLLWLVAQVDGLGGVAYNSSIALRLRGSLDLPALRHAHRRVVERHDALRTTLTEDGRTQIVHPVATAEETPLVVVDLSQPPGGDAEERLREHLVDESGHEFDFGRFPHRTTLVRLAPDLHVLTFTVHHAICDGVGIGVVLRELEEIYSTGVRGEQAEPAVPTQFGDYIAWREGQLVHAEQEAQEKYWADALAGMPELNLPTDRPRPAFKTYSGARVVSRLGGEVLDRLHEFSREHALTHFMTMMAAFDLLLHRVSGQEDLAVGAAFAGRGFPGGDSLVGSCSNAYPIRSTIGPDLSVGDYLTALKVTLLDAYDNQDCPNATLVEKLADQRDLSRSPLYSVVFNWDHYSIPAFHGLETSLQRQPLSAAMYDLMCNVIQVNDELQVLWDYNSDLFDAPTVRHWAACFETLLKAMLADDGLFVSDLPVENS